MRVFFFFKLPTGGVTMAPIQVHALVMAAFTSVIAPFGGYWASAIKRAYGIKDFDSIIPGHGGMTDRMDCQFITALFVSVHYNTFIRYVYTWYARIPRCSRRIAAFSLYTWYQVIIVRR